MFLKYYYTEKKHGQAQNERIAKFKPWKLNS